MDSEPEATIPDHAESTANLEKLRLTAYVLYASLLAELMLPDGAHLRTEDWTVFYLNQTKATMTKGSSIHGTDTLQSPAATEGLASSLASASLTEPEQASSLLGPPRALLHVMSLVRTKHGAAYKR